MGHIAQGIKQQAEALTQSVNAETGKALHDALKADIVTAIGVFSYYGRVGERVLSEKRMPVDKSLMMGRVNVMRHAPKGVVGVISPWNYPVAIAASGIATALMGGNTVVLKPSELTPECGLQLVEIVRNALKAEGLPEDIVQVVTGDGSTGSALVNSDINHMIFTGSSAVGQQIMQSLQAQHKTASMELGGNDPMLVLPGVSQKELDTIASYALWGRFTNAGQACAAVKRLFVPENQLEKITALLTKKLPNIPNAPLISERQRDKLHQQVTQSIAEGAQLIAGGEAARQPGYYYQPTILVLPAGKNPKEITATREETFGPVLSVIPYSTVKDAVAMANDTEYGLTASVFGPNTAAQQVARQLEAGTVVVNDTGAVNYSIPSVPWRGWKNSGPGVSHGPEALLEVTNPQVITSNKLRLLPGFNKMPWHFSRNESDTAEHDLSKALLDCYATESWLEKLKPGLLKALLANRSSKKL